MALFVAMSWAGEARHFSHQARLHTEVARLLAGDLASDHALVDASDHAPAPSQPLISAEALLKKPPLFSESNTDMRHHISRIGPPPAPPRKHLGRPRATPPLPPPRYAV